MAGTINADTLKADSNLRLQIASANVAFIDANGLTIVGNSLNVGGGKIVVTSNNSISTPTVIGANLVTATGTTALGITANGQITTANAPFILTGGQIKFPGTQIASGDANTLDDYEEGDWTPVIADASSGGNTGTYANAGATYTKIGKQVFIQVYMSAINTSGMTAGNTFFIRNLPFVSTMNAQGNFYSYRLGRNASTVSSTLSLGASATWMQIALFTTNSATTDVPLLVSNFVSGTTELIFSISYQAS